MRKTVPWMLLLLLLAGCGGAGREAIPRDTEAIAVFSVSMQQETGDDRELQRDLARWYNVNLMSEKPEPGFEGAYNSILYYDAGVMGYLEVPSLALWLPIFHNDEQNGFVHDANSPFPVGGSGNHTVLRRGEELALAPGDTVVIHILGEAHTYRVGQGGEELCTLVCGEVTYQCGRMVED